MLFRLLHIFNSLSVWNYTTFFYLNVIQILCDGISISTSELTVETVSLSFAWLLGKASFFPFESFTTHSYSYAVWTATHIFLSM